MDFLTDYKIPVGKAAATVFDWMQIHGGWFFDGLADLMDAFIDHILFVLQTPPPLVMILVFVALSYLLRRSWRVSLFVLLGFLFILNQGYWRKRRRA